MKHQIFCLCWLLLFFGSSDTKLLAQYETSQSFAFVHANVIPMHREGILKDHTVVIKSGRIAEIGPSKNIKLSDNLRQIDASGKYLVPGFADMHIHDFGGKLEDDFLLYLANGVTLVRNMSGNRSNVQVREKIAKGGLLAPHYFSTGPMIQTAQYEIPDLDKLPEQNKKYARKFVNHVRERILTLKSENDIDGIILEHKKYKYDFIKIHDNFPKNQYLRLLKAAKEAGIPVVGHAQRKLPLKHSTELKSISHIEEFLHLFSKKELQDKRNFLKLGRRVAETKVTIAPTLLTFDMIHRYSEDEKFGVLLADTNLKYIPTDYRNLWASDMQPYRSRKWFGTPEGQRKILGDLETLKALTKAMNDAGVPLILGTDVYGFVLPGFGVHKELELLVSAGLSPYQALRTTTTNVSDYLGKEKYDGGSIEKGKAADLVLLEKNPLKKIRNTRTIFGVAAKGKWLDRESLDDLVQRVEQKYKK
jgi:imidazolonepropionase-like amidohydrolase